MDGMGEDVEPALDPELSCVRDPGQSINPAGRALRWSHQTMLRVLERHRSDVTLLTAMGRMVALVI